MTSGVCSIAKNPNLSMKSTTYQTFLPLFLAGLFCLIGLSACDSGSNDPEVEIEEEVFTPDRSIQVSINTDEGRQAISPYIYGSNQELSSTDVWTLRRLGGNRMTGYNWENDYSNAGEDWMHSSDEYLLSLFGVSASTSESGRVMTTFHDQSVAMGAESMITLQMAGYVSADGNGNVSEGQTAPSNRWKRVEFTKGTSFSTAPDRTDDIVYMDEFVHFMVDRYGNAATEDGVRWYVLDNEPGLWSHTHPRIHPDNIAAADLVNRSIELARAVKAVDPEAKIVGPALYGFAAYESLQGAPDWNQERVGSWFIDYYLSKMREAEQTYGMRLLDVFDVHWYPEAQGDNRITLSEDAGTENDVLARLQAPRTLWDPTYVEDSWIGQWKKDFLPIIPTIQASIEQYYPGTELSITEYNYGATNAISGGLAQADVLGVFGENNIHAAALWKLHDANSYASSAFNLYRNYDGQRSVYGNTSVDVTLGDQESFSVYAAINGDDESQLHIIAINKHTTDATEFTFDIQSAPSYSEAEIWYFDQEGPRIRRRASQDVSGNTLTYTVPALSATHFIFR